MDLTRKSISGGAKYEDFAGYSRVLITGPFVFCSGTTAITPENTVYAEGDAYEQAKYIFNKLIKLMEENGVSRKDVVKVNLFTPDTKYNDDISRAFAEFFKADVKPACTWTGVKSLNRPTQLVEVEMEAIIGSAFKD